MKNLCGWIIVIIGLPVICILSILIVWFEIAKGLGKQLAD